MALTKYYAVKNHKGPKQKSGEYPLVMSGTLIEMDEKEAAPLLKDGILKSHADIVKDKIDVVVARKEGHLKQAKACDEEVAALKSQIGSQSKPEPEDSELPMLKKGQK